MFLNKDYVTYQNTLELHNLTFHLFYSEYYKKSIWKILYLKHTYIIDDQVCGGVKSFFLTACLHCMYNLVQHTEYGACITTWRNKCEYESGIN